MGKGGWRTLCFTLCRAKAGISQGKERLGECELALRSRGTAVY